MKITGVTTYHFTTAVCLSEWDIRYTFVERKIKLGQYHTNYEPIRIFLCIKSLLIYKLCFESWVLILHFHCDIPGNRCSPTVALTSRRELSTISCSIPVQIWPYVYASTTICTIVMLNAIVGWPLMLLGISVY